VELTEGIHPDWRLVANSQDITDTIKARLISLSLTDESGMDSDVLEIVLSDNDPENPIRKPPKGAELRFSLGYDGNLKDMGLFVADEFEIAGWPGELTIRARAAIFGASKGGKTNLQSQKNRDWPKGTKLGAMVAKIAKDHGMESAVAADLKGITLPHIDQADESDINLLIRVAKKYDAIVKPADGKIILAKRGSTKSVGGKQMPTIELEPYQCSRFRLVDSSRETAGTVVAYWHAVKQAKRNEVKVGDGEPVTRLKTYYPTQDMALAAARADLSRRSRNAVTLSIETVGAPEYAAECPLKLPLTWHPDVAGDWVVKRVVHNLGSDGYRCQLEGEKPDTSDGAKVAVVQHGTKAPVLDDSWLDKL
jgi:phage protein D